MSVSALASPELNDNKIDVTRDKVVNETTVKKTHLKSEIEFFITHPKRRKIVTNRLRKQRSESGCGGCYTTSNPFRVTDSIGWIERGIVWRGL